MNCPYQGFHGLHDLSIIHGISNAHHNNRSHPTMANRSNLSYPDRDRHRSNVNIDRANTRSPNVLERSTSIE